MGAEVFEKRLEAIEKGQRAILAMFQGGVLREEHLCARLKVSPNTARKIRREDPTFPKRRKLVGDVEGWLAEEVDEWLRRRPVSERDVRDGKRGRAA